MGTVMKLNKREDGNAITRLAASVRASVNKLAELMRELDKRSIGTDFFLDRDQTRSPAEWAVKRCAAVVGLDAVVSISLFDDITALRDAVRAVCARFNEGDALGVSVNFNIDRSGPNNTYAVSTCDITRKY